MKADAEGPRWRTILACTICFAVGGNAIAFVPASLFVSPLTSELGWSRTQFFSGMSLATLVAAVILPFVGQIVDRWGARAAIIPGILTFGAVVAALSKLNGSWFQYMVIMAILGVAVMLHGPLPYSRVAVAAAGTKRGIGLAIAFSGSTIGVIAIPQFCAFVISEYGWRMAELSLGALVIIVALPAALLFIPRKSHATTVAVESASTSKGPFPWHQLRSPVFWILGTVLILNSIAVHAFVANVGDVAVGRGLAIGIAATAISASGMGSAVARIASGWMLDRYNSPQIAQVWFSLAVAGLAIATFANSPVMLIVAAALIGATLGAEIEIVAYFTSRFFPTNEYGRIYGLLYAFFMIGVSLGPLLFAVIVDLAGSYASALIAMGLFQLSSCLILSRIGPYRFNINGDAV